MTVRPTHRRRGILTRMMEYQLREIHQRGEPLAALSASESVIYGRFGYGIGSLREDWNIQRAHAAYAHPGQQAGALRFIDPEEARVVCPRVCDRACAERPGYVRYNEALWNRFLADPERERRGARPLFYLVYEEDGRVDGYVLYRHKNATLIVQELMAATDSAASSLWHFCFGVDLISSIEAVNRPLDDPLPWMLADPRRLERLVRDTMWLRLVDVRAALSGRRYAVEGRLVLEVRDPFCSWNQGVFALEGGPDGARCDPSRGSPDVVLSAADLAEVYLGTVKFGTLSRAGRVDERSTGALNLADDMFATQLQPWTPMFL